MSEFRNRLARHVADSEGYQKSSNSVFESYVLNLISSEQKLERSEIKKLISAAQILYASEDSKLQAEGAVVLSMLLDLYGKEYPDLIPIANNLFNFRR